MIDDFDDIVDNEDLDYTSNYKPLEVTQAELDIKKQCRNFVRAMASVYGDLDYLPNDSELTIHSENKTQIAFLQQADMEVIPLESILFQVQVGKHVLKTLMEHMNGGGSADATLFDRIFKAQVSLMGVTNTLSKYIRSLPNFFYQLSEDLKAFEIDTPAYTSDDVEYVESNPSLISQHSEVDDDYSAKPFMGQGDLLKAIREQRESLNIDIQKSENVDVTKEGNEKNNPLRGEDGKMNLGDLLSD
jgi:hypothetical protein